jgi:hypothetical protein
MSLLPLGGVELQAHSSEHSRLKLATWARRFERRRHPLADGLAMDCVFMEKML